MNFKRNCHRHNEKALWTTDIYIKQLKEPTGTLVTEGKRRTAFVKCLVCIGSVKALFERLVACEDPPMRYLLTYKFSQDHLELFFSSVSSATMTTPRYFSSRLPTSGYLRIMMTGNCIIQDGTYMLSVMPDTSSVTNMHIMRNYDLIERKPIGDDHDYAGDNILALG